VPFTIPPDLHPDVLPLAFLLGRWEGRGAGEYPGVEAFEFGHEITFSTDTRPFVSYAARSWRIDPDGAVVAPLHVEYGFWRPRMEGALEVVLAQPNGQAEVWYGSVSGAKVELATDAVMRTQTAEDPYTAGRRLYGLVEGDLMWAFDKATEQQPLTTYTWARLERA
jgi:hypothetical protein